MKRNLLHAFFVLLGIALLWTAGTRHPGLLTARQLHQLDHAEPLENAPPLLVFTTVALGGFSGVLSDLMWVRAAQLQMEGNYLELVQLADWITKLQPRFAQGWIYHAWNLAYNVSVMFPRPEDRWRWVRHGIELLRDGGLRYNPAHPTLYREMAWIYQHKLGMTTDAAHAYYKMAWAQEMARLFDGRGPDYAALASTPSTRSALLRVPQMPQLIEALREREIDPFTYQWPPAGKWDEMQEILQSHPGTGEILLRHVQLRMLMDRYRLAPDRMLEIEQVIGPLDWRLPQAHAVYWAWSGIPHASGWEAVMLDRMIFQSMAEAFRQGIYFFSAEEDRFIPSPAPDLLPYVERAFQRSLMEYDDDTMRTAHLNFLNHALVVMFTHDREAAARAVFEQIRSLYPEASGATEFQQYLLDQLAGTPDFVSLPDVAHRIAQALYFSFYWQALGDDARAAGYQHAAEWFWHYQASQDAFDYWELESGAREAVLNDLISDVSKDRIR